MNTKPNIKERLKNLKQDQGKTKMSLKLNIRERLTNKQFMTSLILSLAVMVGSYFSLSPTDLTTWSAIGDVALKIVNNPWAIGSIVWNIYNAFTNPLTDGLGD